MELIAKIATNSIYIFFISLIIYKLTLKPNVTDLDNGYFSPLLLPISGSQSLKLDHVSKLVPVKKIRTLLKCILLTSALGSV